MLRHDVVRKNAAKTHGFCSHIQRSNTASSHLETSQVFTLRYNAEDGKYYLFALVKKSLAILRLTNLLNDGFR